MKYTSLEMLACPFCHSHLVIDNAGNERTILSGTLTCPSCSKEYPIQKGIPHFINTSDLTGLNHRFSHLYNWFSWIYSTFSKVAFAYIGMPEEQGRREITDRLDPHGGRVLEVSIGPGVNLPYLVKRPDVGEVFGLDISPGQLQRCQSFAAKKGWGVELFLANGEQLPFQDGSFDGVFHVGGINFFNDKQHAIDEMVRVSRAGARILIADETEKGARGYEKFIPGFKRSIGGKRPRIEPPVNLVPPEMQEMRVFDVWKGWLYCLEFRKPWEGMEICAGTDQA
jgi:ubiquinone/menaquinone biosynthesis C-methylase UbiE/uncharacterized protein YbaR (Trm112 family)